MKKVKLLDYSHEKDLENAINLFLNECEDDIIDIRFQVSVGVFAEEQLFCFSAMIIYETE